MKIPTQPPNYREDFLSSATTLAEAIARGHRLTYYKYLHWSDLRERKDQVPAGITLAEWWAAHRFVRAESARELPLQDNEGSPFNYNVPPELEEALHLFDRASLPRLAKLADTAHMATVHASWPEVFAEEAISSSRLEGASTTTERAIEMIRTGRAPLDQSERMIYDNFSALKWVDQNFRRAPTPELVMQLHSAIVRESGQQGTGGRFRRADGDEGEIGVYDNSTNECIHRPPHASELPERLAKLCAFAAGSHTDTFLHPVIRAFVAHFMVGFDHPFVDGNGRTARALFYWVMLRSDYTFVRSLSISEVLQQAPVQYVRSYLLSENDGGDLTYFLLYQAKVLRRAIEEELEKQLPDQSAPVEAAQANLTLGLPTRQRSVMQRALAESEMRMTVAEHQETHQITRKTAQADLDNLVQLGLLHRYKEGKAFVYTPPSSFTAALKLQRPKSPLT